MAAQFNKPLIRPVRTAHLGEVSVGDINRMLATICKIHPESRPFQAQCELGSS